MKRVIASISATIVSLVMLLSFKTHSPAIVAQPSADESSVATGDTPTATGKPSASKRTVIGDSISTRWGSVQVKVTLTGTKVSSIDVVDYPQTNSRDLSINSVAVPKLVSQALTAQSADIDGVSGATYTTEGFIRSLQSALNKS